MGSLFNILIQYRGMSLIDIPRQIFGWIDAAIYGLIPEVYGLIEDLSRIQIFDTGVLQGFYEKVYLLITIVMLFKLSFSIVSYILDPTKAMDKNQGMGKIFTNVIIMFVMLLSAPVAFKYLTKLQNAILDDNIIQNFLFQEGSATDYVVSNGVILGNPDSCQSWNDIDSDFEYTGPVVSKAADNGNYLAVNIYKVFYNIADLREGSADNIRLSDHSNVFKYMCSGTYENVNVSTMISYINVYNKDGKNHYVIEYKWLVASAIGVFVLLLLVSIAFDVAVRAIKLGFYQLIAPVAIVSYIDPNSGKNGIFNKYIKALGKTWVSLFVRLFSVFFAVYIVKQIDLGMYDRLVATGYETNSSEFFINLFIIIGALMFAKQFPQLLEELFPGMKMGKMQLNPFKNIAENALGGKALLGGAAALGAAGLGMTTNMGSRLFDKNTWKMRNKDGNVTFGSVMKGLGGGISKAATSGIAGGVSSGFRAGRMTSKDGKLGKGMWTGYQESNKARFDRDDNLRKAGVVTAKDKAKYIMGSLGADAARMTGNLTAGQKNQISLQEQKAMLEQSKYELEQRKNAALEPVKSYASYMDQIKNAIDNDSAVKTAKENLEMAKAGQLKGAHGKGAIAQYKAKLAQAESAAYSKFMSTGYGQKLKTAAISAVDGMNLSDTEKSSYSNFDDYSGFKKNRNDSKTLVSSRELDFIKDEQNIKAQEVAIHEFENSSDYKMSQATNSDRKSTGTLKPGQQVSSNIGNITDNPYYNPGYYGNNGGSGKPSGGGNGGGRRGGGRP